MILSLRWKILSSSLVLFLWSAPVAFRRVALETPEWTSRDSHHHRQSVSAGKTNAIPTEPSGRLFFLTGTVGEFPSDCITASLGLPKVKARTIIFVNRSINSSAVCESNPICLGGIYFNAVSQQVVSVHNLCNNSTLLGTSCYDGKTA